MSFDQANAFDAASHTWHPIDHRTPLDDLIENEEGDDSDASQLNMLPPDALLILLRFLIPPPNGRNQCKRWRTAQLKLAVLAHAAGLEGVAEHTLAELGDQLGVTRALMSLYAIKLTDELKQEMVRGGKRRVSRESYRQSAIRSHAARGHAMKQDV